MNRDEFKQLLKVMKSVYTSPKFLPTQESWEIWFRALQDVPYKIAEASLIKHMQISEFEPKICNLREGMVNNTDDGELNAWSLVSKAMGNSNYNSVEEFNSLPPLVQKAVGSPATLREWAQTNIETISVVQSQFLKTYRALKSNADTVGMISLDARKALGIASAVPESLRIEPKAEPKQEYHRTRTTPSEADFEALRRKIMRG